VLRRLTVAFVALTLASGCGGSYAHHHHASHPHGGGGGAIVFAAGVGLLAGVAIASSSHPPPPEERVVERVIYVEAPPPIDVMPPPRDRERATAPELPPFPAAEARAALSDVDLAACRDTGAPRGHGHAQVTFNPDGAVSKVVVDTPDGLPAPAVQCIGDRLGAVRVAEYKGSLVTVGTSWFVP
jgi:hypothetical protein